MDPKDIQELKTGIKKARQATMHFAYAPSMIKGEEDVAMFHRKKAVKSLLKQVKQATKNPRVVWGYVTVEGTEFKIQYVDKEPSPTLIKKLKKFIKDNAGLQFKYITIDPNSPEAKKTSHDDDDYDDVYDNDDPDIEDEQEENADDSQTDEQDQAALKERLKAAVAAAAKRAQGVMGQDKDQDSAIKTHLKEAQDAANRLDETATKDALKAAFDAMAAPVEGQSGSDPKEVAAAFKALQVQRANIETNLTNLINTMSSHADPRIQLIAAKGPASSITGKSGILKGFLDVVLTDLKAWNSAPPDKKEAAAKKLSASITGLMTYVNSSDLVNLLESNPLGVKVAIKQPLSTALNQLKDKIAA